MYNVHTANIAGGLKNRIFYTIHRRLINYRDTKAKCRHLKKFTWKGTLRQVLIRVFRLEIQSVILVFSTHLCELFSLSPSLCFNSTPPPPPSQTAEVTDCEWLGGGGGCWILLETIFYRSLTLCTWPDSEPTKLLDHPPTKTQERRGPQKDTHLPQSPFTG